MNPISATHRHEPSCRLPCPNCGKSHLGTGANQYYARKHAQELVNTCPGARPENTLPPGKNSETANPLNLLTSDNLTPAANLSRGTGVQGEPETGSIEPQPEHPRESIFRTPGGIVAPENYTECAGVRTIQGKDVITKS